MLKEIVIAGTIFAIGAPAVVAHQGARQAHRRMHAVQSLERFAEWLELTPRQVEDLQALRENRRASRRELRERMKTAAVEYRNLRNAGDPNADRALDALRQLREEAFAMRLAARVDAERILTPEQREKIEQRRSERQRR